MRMLVVGNGGREHAMAWKLAQSEQVEAVFVAPGNPGTANEPKCENVDIGVLDFEKLAQFAVEQDIVLTIVGPEAPLVGGIREAFDRAGQLCLAPPMLAAQLEGSKQFAKEFMQRHGIPTARFSAFTDAQAAKLFARDMPLPIVIKADGLAAGKGVVIAESLAEAEQVIDDMLSGQAFGEAGSRVVIEEFLPGEEASYIVISDGERTAAFATSQDHKRVGNDDQGPNTGGMGAYSPAPVVTQEVADRVERDIIAPVIRGMRSEGLCYQGFLYAGLMIDALGQPRVVEFNCRFGDPETQPILMRLDDDFAALCLAAAKGNLKGEPLRFSDESAVTVVMASEGYPAQPRTGDPISGLADIQGGKVFHAGTRFEDDQIVTSGGRVLGVTAMGRDLAEAQTHAYFNVRKIHFDGCHYRTDIGFRALNL